MWAGELLDPIGIDTYSKPEKKHEFAVSANTQALKTLLRTKGLNSENCIPYIIINCIPCAGVSCYILPRLKENSFWVGATNPFIRTFELEEEPVADKKNYEFGIYWILPKYFAFASQCKQHYLKFSLKPNAHAVEGGPRRTGSSVYLSDNPLSFSSSHNARAESGHY